jgi:hypothetical protein
MKAQPPIWHGLWMCILLAFGLIFSGCASDSDAASAHERAAADAGAKALEPDPLSSNPNVGGLFPHDRE